MFIIVFKNSLIVLTHGLSVIPILSVCDSDFVSFPSLYVLYFLVESWTLYRG